MRPAKHISFFEAKIFLRNFESMHDEYGAVHELHHDPEGGVHSYVTTVLDIKNEKSFNVIMVEGKKVKKYPIFI